VPWPVVAGALALVLALVAAAVHRQRGGPSIDERFDRPDGLVTNEYARWNPDDGAAVRSEVWEVTSGSLFAAGGTGWSGRPDRTGPDARSATATNSAVFRLVSHEDRFGDVRVSLDLSIDRWEADGPVNDWDGVHLFLRYQSAQELYYASVARRDGSVVAKKKAPAGATGATGEGEGEDGEYRTLASVPGDRLAPGWHRVEARIRTLERPPGVAIAVAVDGRAVLEALDDGATGPPIDAPGRVGIRADNTEFHVDNLVVAPL
jgi:hypothetical protein